MYHSKKILDDFPERSGRIRDDDLPHVAGRLTDDQCDVGSVKKVKIEKMTTSETYVKFKFLQINFTSPNTAQQRPCLWWPGPVLERSPKNLNLKFSKISLNFFTFPACSIPIVSSSSAVAVVDFPVTPKKFDFCQKIIPFLAIRLTDRLC